LELNGPFLEVIHRYGGNIAVEVLQEVGALTSTEPENLMRHGVLTLQDLFERSGNFEDLESATGIPREPLKRATDVAAMIVQLRIDIPTAKKLYAASINSIADLAGREVSALERELARGDTRSPVPPREKLDNLIAQAKKAEGSMNTMDLVQLA
jgi:Domain of unknown function (DUF4332)